MSWVGDKDDNFFAFLRIVSVLNFSSQQSDTVVLDSEKRTVVICEQMEETSSMSKDDEEKNIGSSSDDSSSVELFEVFKIGSSARQSLLSVPLSQSTPSPFHLHLSYII